MVFDLDRPEHERGELDWANQASGASVGMTVSWWAGVTGFRMADGHVHVHDGVMVANAVCRSAATLFSFVSEAKPSKWECVSAVRSFLVF